MTLGTRYSVHRLRRNLKCVQIKKKLNTLLESKREFSLSFTDGPFLFVFLNVYESASDFLLGYVSNNQELLKRSCKRCKLMQNSLL